jgi:aminoglycoside phosphotransferase (APT) family kinase protein
MTSYDTIDVSLVRKLVASQFPQWAHLHIKPVENGGWDNRTFHLGEQMSIRLPSAEDYAPKVEIEQYWLPKLAPHLPLPIPTPLAMGNPGDGYPWHWSIYKLIDGKTASIKDIANLTQFATSLGQFLTALEKIDPTGGPLAGPHNFYRGGSLAHYDGETRQAIALLGDTINTKEVTEVWNAALSSTWQGSPVWVHGDIALGNLLIKNGQLSAVIDFGGLGVGDPACDLVMAWTVFTGECRKVFRAGLPTLDKATWERARGWALWKALIVCAELAGASPLEKEKSWKVLKEVLADDLLEKE